MSEASRTMLWEAAYATGIPAVDCQHQSLFKALRCLHEALSAGTAQAEIGVILEFLEKYARVHFTDEETLMLRAGFPGLPVHRAEHRDFQIRLHDLRAGHLDEGTAVSQETSRRLFEGFRDHILVQDMAFVRHLRPFEAPVS